MNKYYRKSIEVLFLFLFAQAMTASAATITWSSQVYTNTGALKELAGTGQFDQSLQLVYAENCGGSTVNFDGIDFVGNTGLMPGAFGGYHESTTTNPVSSSGNWAVTTTNITLGTGGVSVALVSGTYYKIQLLFMDGRSGYAGRNVTLDGDYQGVYANGDGGSTTYGNGLLVSGTFIADSPSITFEIASTGGSQLNALLLHSSHYVVTNEHLYELGEPGTVSGFPLDSRGTADFEGKAGNALISSSNPSSVSSNYMAFDGTQFYWMNNANLSAFPTDDFAVELWANASNATQSAILFTTGNGAGRVKFHLAGGKWRASYDGVAWIDDNSASVVADRWYHLAVIRTNGVSRFYVDGLVRGGGATGAPVHNGYGHLACDAGGAQPLTGAVDNVRMFTFDHDLVSSPAAELTIYDGYTHFTTHDNWGTTREETIFTDPSLTTPVDRSAATTPSPVYFAVNGLESDGGYWNAVIRADGMLGDGAGTPGGGGAGTRVAGSGILMRGDGSANNVMDEITFSLHSYTELTSTGRILILQKMTAVALSNFRVGTQSFNDGAGNSHSGAGGSTIDIKFDRTVDSKQIIGTGSGNFRLHAAKFQFGSCAPPSIFYFW